MRRSKELEEILAIQKKETPQESIKRRQLVTVIKPAMLKGHKAQVNWYACGWVEIAFTQAFGQAVLEAARVAREMDKETEGLGIPKRVARNMEDLVAVGVGDDKRKRGRLVNWHAIGEVNAQEAEVFGNNLLAAAKQAQEMDERASVLI